MKKMTCRECEGVCDVELTAETPEEMGKKAAEHAMSVNDDAHRTKMQEMAQHYGDKEFEKKFWADFKKRFEAAPDA